MIQNCMKSASFIKLAISWPSYNKVDGTLKLLVFSNKFGQLNNKSPYRYH